MFRAFAHVVAEGADSFVVLDTAPTGHTLLLLDAAEAYHREVSRTQGDVPDAVRQLLPRLRDPQFTRILLVTLPEATPVHEAAQLQDDLRRAGIEPFAWVVNQSFASWRGARPGAARARRARSALPPRSARAPGDRVLAWVAAGHGRRARCRWPIGLRQFARGGSDVMPRAKRLNVFERYLSLWVALCMVAGVVLGKAVPAFMEALRGLEFGAGSQINVPIAVLIWLMITPMMMKVDFGAIRDVGRRPRGLFVTLFVNWLVKPFSMAAIAWLFFRLSSPHGSRRPTPTSTSPAASSSRRRRARRWCSSGATCRTAIRRTRSSRSR